MKKENKKTENLLTDFFKIFEKILTDALIKNSYKTTSNNYFKKALEVILRHEGGYVNHPADPGGATNRGITQRTYNKWLESKNLPKKNVKEITQKEVEAIYYQNYWLKAQADKIQNPKLSLIVFDTAVLHGVAKAKKYFEESKGDMDKYLNLRQAHYDYIVEKHPNRKVFHKGWTNRNEGLRKIEFC